MFNPPIRENHSIFTATLFYAMRITIAPTHAGVVAPWVFKLITDVVKSIFKGGVVSKHILIVITLFVTYITTTPCF